MHQFGSNLLLALQFLHAIPQKVKSCGDEQNLKHGMKYINVALLYLLMMEVVLKLAWRIYMSQNLQKSVMKMA